MVLNESARISRWSKNLIVIALLGLLAGCSAGADGSQETQGQAGSEGDVAVAVRVVEQHTVTRNITLTGQLEAEAQAQVVSAGGGEVVKVHVKAGDVVKVGRPLLELDLNDQIRQLEQQVNQAEAALGAISAANAEAELALAIAQREYDRMEPLYAEGAISRQQWEQINDNLERAKLALEDQVPAQKQQSETALAQAQRQLDTTRKNAVVSAPIAGEVASVATSVGNFAAPGNPLVTIISRDQVNVRANLTDTQIVQVQPGSQVQVRVPALGSEPFSGEVTEVGLTPDPMSGGFPVKFVIPNPDLRLRPGLFAEVTVPVETVEQVVAVPADAVLRREDAEVVFVVVGNVAHERVVTSGLTDGSFVEISSGLDPGDQVVVVGHHYLADGTSVIVTTQESTPSDQGDS